MGYYIQVWEINLRWQLVKSNLTASTFWGFVQECDVFPIIRTHCFGADAVAHGSLLTVDLTESTVQVLLPVNFITVDLKRQKIK